MPPPQRMGIDALLGSRATVEQGGVRALSDRGDLCYHIPVLTHALRQRRAPSTTASLG